MRLSAVLACLAALASPALAADSIADQAQDAFDVFAAGQSQLEFLSAGYGKAALSDVSGNWVNLNGPAPGTGIETYGVDAAKFCKTPAALTLASPDPLTMTLTAKPAATAFSQVYTLIAGSTFSQYTDPTPYFVAIGLGPERVGRQFDDQRVAALAAANGVVQIYRPSADILVIQRDKAYPTILARCPKV